MRLTVESRLEIGIALAGASLVTFGIALIYPPAAVIVAGLFLLASLADLRRQRP